MMDVPHYRSKRIPDLVYTFSKMFEDETKFEQDQKLLKKNPFQANDEMDTTDKIKFGVGFLLIPIRVFLGAMVFIIAQICLILTTVGTDTSKPLPANIMKIQQTIMLVQTTIITLIFGLIVDVKGKPASSKKCKVQAWGPHSSMFDPLIVAHSTGGRPFSAVAKAEIASNGFMKAAANANQAILVNRNNKKNKAKAAEEIKLRASAKEWRRPVSVFPEGTTTNRTSLIQFKEGAFRPGAPVQPCIIRWDKKDLPWTSGSGNRLMLTLRSIADLYHVCQVEFLPVYYPSKEEIENPILYTSNVRQVMADALGLETTEFSYTDRALARKVAKAKLLPAKVLDFSFQTTLDRLQQRLKDSGKSPCRDSYKVLKDFDIVLTYFLKHCCPILSTLGGRNLNDLSEEIGIDRLDSKIPWEAFYPSNNNGHVTFGSFVTRILEVKYGAWN